CGPTPLSMRARVERVRVIRLFYIIAAYSRPRPSVRAERGPGLLSEACCAEPANLRKSLRKGRLNGTVGTPFQEALVSSERLTSSEKRALLLWILVAIVGAVFASKYFFRAFPEASVDFRVSRGEALRRAQEFVTSLGENASGYRSAIVFAVDDDAKTYLEREL